MGGMKSLFYPYRKGFWFVDLMNIDNKDGELSNFIRTWRLSVSLYEKASISHGPIPSEKKIDKKDRKKPVCYVEGMKMSKSNDHLCRRELSSGV